MNNFTTEARDNVLGSYRTDLIMCCCNPKPNVAMALHETTICCSCTTTLRELSTPFCKCRNRHLILTWTCLPIPPSHFFPSISTPTTTAPTRTIGATQHKTTMTTTATALLIYTLLLLQLPSAFAHSSLGEPLPYSTYACKGDTTWCKTPCPPLSRNGQAPARNSPQDPAATWKRGDTVQITWHKNNHRGGFYRRSLVPVKHMFDHAWHKKTAFDFGCWAQGTFNCGKDTPLCGGDKKGRAYRNSIKIPSVFPDGDYVFAQVWYGKSIQFYSVCDYSNIHCRWFALAR